MSAIRAVVLLGLLAAAGCVGAQAYVQPDHGVPAEASTTELEDACLAGDDDACLEVRRRRQG